MLGMKFLRQSPKLRRAAIWCACLLALAFATAPAFAAPPPEIWFNPLNSNRNPSGRGLQYSEHDLPAVMASDAEWANANAHIKVLGLPGNVVWSYPDKAALVKFVNSHAWKFSLSLGVMYVGDVCTVRYEGVSLDTDYNHEAVHIIQNWKRMGGRLDYVVLDAPLYYSHYDRPDCSLSVEAIAQRSANTMRMVLAEFPDVQIVDAEGPGRTPNDVWLADMQHWIRQFQRASGHRIDAVTLDLHWRDLRQGNSWQDTTSRAVQTMHRLGMKIGLNINAEAGVAHPQTNAQWMDANRLHIDQAINSNLGVDYIHFAQWHHHVELNLPETDPMAYTSLVNYAVAAMAAAGMR